MAFLDRYRSCPYHHARKLRLHHLFHWHQSLVPRSRRNLWLGPCTSHIEQCAQKTSLSLVFCGYTLCHRHRSIWCRSGPRRIFAKRSQQLGLATLHLLAHGHWNYHWMLWGSSTKHPSKLRDHPSHTGQSARHTPGKYPAQGLSRRPDYAFILGY